MRARFDLIDVILILVFGGFLFGVGILIGMFWFGPHWYASQNCFSYPFLLVDPHFYIACKIP